MRLASLSPAVTEILFAMEQQKHIVCRDWFSDYPEEVSVIPRLKDHQNVDAGELRAFQPDIVFLSTLVQAKLAEHLRGEGFTVIHQDPRSIADIEESIRQIGILVDSEPRAQALVETLRKDLHDTKRTSGLLSRKPKIYVEEWHNPPMVSGNWVPDIIRLAGGIPFGVKSGQWKVESDGRNSPSHEVSLEDIQTFDPDIIVLSICGAGLSASKSLLTDRVGWQDLRAVRENHLFVIDDSLLNRPGPRIAEGAKRLFGWAFQAAHS